MRLIIHKDYDAASRWAADYIARRIKGGIAQGARHFVMGLSAGSSSLGIYRELIGMNKAGKVSFDQVVTFNTDEYAGLPEDHPQSRHRFMWDNFFNHINIRKECVHILDGMAPDLAGECRAYEGMIDNVGGIGLFLGGVGADGHIAFNEPGSSLTSRTRLKTLTRDTRLAKARFFDGDPEKVPAAALTVGVGTIMDAREVLIPVSGHAKARALQAAVEGCVGVNHIWTLSCLQLHPRAIIVCDEDAARELKMGTVKYFNEQPDDPGGVPSP
jgi:glucosamine-6-phosphate deaminase